MVTALVLRRLAVVALLTSATALASSCDTVTSDTAEHNISEAQSVDSLWMPVPRPFGLEQQMPEVPTRIIKFETAEGTFMNVDVSPDGETLIFDLLGDIYSLPVSGGQAIPLTVGRAWDQAPRFSPDGKSVYFASDRVGFKNIWRMMLSDKTVEQITASAGDIMGSVNWSLHDRHLLASRAGAASNLTAILHKVHPETGQTSSLDVPDKLGTDLDLAESISNLSMTYSAVQAPDGQVYFSGLGRQQGSGKSVVRIYSFSPTIQALQSITSSDASYSEYAPQLSHDGTVLAYFRQDDQRRTTLRLRERETGRDRVLTTLADADDASSFADVDTRPNYTFTPDDRHIVFWHGGKIHRVDVENGVSEIIPFQVKVKRETWERAKPAVQRIDDQGQAKIIRWPSQSRDGQTLVFAAIGYVWLMDMRTGLMRRLTGAADLEYMPSLSPDGKSVAYISFAQSKQGYGPARLMIADIESGESRELLAAIAEREEAYLLPNWSDDGQKIAIIREKWGEGGGTSAEIETLYGWTDVDQGEFQIVASAPVPDDNDARASLYLYARTVDFDPTGNTLWFSYRISMKQTVLAAAELDGSGQRVLAVSTAEVDGIAPSPDLKHLALTTHIGQVWVVPFEVGEEPIDVTTLSPVARRASEVGGYYVDWADNDELTFGFGQYLYHYSMDEYALAARRIRVAFEKPAPTQPIAFKGARLITLSDQDGASSVIERGTIIVKGQRIIAIGSADEVAVPIDAHFIDVSGKTIIPGLLDTHYHGLGGLGKGLSDFSAFGMPKRIFGDPSAIAYGVTSAWSPGGAVNDGDPATVDLQESGRISGPRWSHAAVGGVGYPWELLTSYTAALAAVEQHRDLGVVVLKEYLAPTREQRQWLSKAAYVHDLGIVSHLQSFDGTMTRIVDGYTGGDHPYLPVPFYEDVQQLMIQTGYIWTPNIVITPGTVGTKQNKRDYFCYAVLEWRSRTRSRVTEIDPICPPDPVSITVPYNTQRFSRVANQAASSARNGVHIGVSAHNIPGSNLHSEMWYLWKGGMAIEDVLRATTMVNAEKLGLQEEIGSLEAGKMADFLILDENPLDDILNTLSLKNTVQGGVVYDSATAERADLSEIAEQAEKHSEAANDDDGSQDKTGTDD